MSAARGFLALAAMIFGGWRPLYAAAAALLFAAAEALGIQLQTSGAGGAQLVLQLIPLQKDAVGPVVARPVQRDKPGPRCLGTAPRHRSQLLRQFLNRPVRRPAPALCLESERDLVVADGEGVAFVDALVVDAHAPADAIGRAKILDEVGTPRRKTTACLREMLPSSIARSAVWSHAR